MSPTALIVLLTLLGFLMLAAEVFVPGMILGILGLLALAGAVVMAYAEFGPLGGSLVFAAVTVVTGSGFVAWMFAFPKTSIGRRIMLSRQLGTGMGEKSKPAGDLLGATGEALTPLRPSGTAKIGDRKVDVVAETGLIEAGTKIVVVAQEGIRVVVRPAA